MADDLALPWRTDDPYPDVVTDSNDEEVASFNSTDHCEFAVKAANNHEALMKALAIIDGELKFYQEENDRGNLTDMGKHAFSVLGSIRKRISAVVGSVRGAE